MLFPPSAAGGGRVRRAALSKQYRWEVTASSPTQQPLPSAFMREAVCKIYFEGFPETPPHTLKKF